MRRPYKTSVAANLPAPTNSRASSTLPKTLASMITGQALIATKTHGPAPPSSTPPDVRAAPPPPHDQARTGGCHPQHAARWMRSARPG